MANYNPDQKCSGCKHFNPTTKPCEECGEPMGTCDAIEGHHCPDGGSCCDAWSGMVRYWFTCCGLGGEDVCGHEFSSHRKDGNECPECDDNDLHYEGAELDGRDVPGETMPYSQVRHVGLNADRLGCPDCPIENAFAEHWAETNVRERGINHGFGTLELLVTTKRDASMHHRLQVPPPHPDWWPHHISQRDAEVAASVVQWLGTACGQAWLDEAFDEAGYTMTLKKKGGPDSG